MTVNAHVSARPATVGAKMCFFMLRHQYATIQALLTVDKENVSKKMLKYATR